MSDWETLGPPRADEVESQWSAGGHFRIVGLTGFGPVIFSKPEPPHARGDVDCTDPPSADHAQQGAVCRPSGLPATSLPLFLGRLQLPVALCVDLLLPPRQHILRRDVARRAVQPNIVVVD